MERQNGQGPARWASLGIAIGVGLFAFFTPVSIAAAHTSFAIAGALLLAHAESRRFAGRLAATHPLRAPIALWCAASILAVVFAVDPSLSAGKLNKLALIALLALGALPRVRDALPRILAALLASTTVVALYGLAEHVLAGGGLLARVRGISGFYLTVAGIVMVVALLAISLSLAEARRGARRRAIVLAAAAAVLLAALVGTYARGSWLGFAAGVVALAFVLRSRLLIAALVAAAVLGYAAAPAPIKDRLGSILDPRFPLNQERVVIWKHGLSLVSQRPWTGYGLVIPKQILEREVRTRDGVVHIHSHMHNAYLQIAVSMGIPALIVFIFLIASFFRMAGRAARAAHRNASESGLVTAYPAILAALLVNGLVEWNFGDSEILGLFYLLSGLVLGIEVERGRAGAACD